MRHKLVSIVLVRLLLPQTALPQALTKTAARFELTVENIMRGPELYGYPPQSVRWSADSQRVYFRWKQASDRRDKDFDTYVVNRDGSGLRKLSEEEEKEAPPVAGDDSKDKKWTVYSEAGDLFLYDQTAGKRRQITKTSENESLPRLTADAKGVSFQRGNNLYLISLDGGSLEQLTDIRAAGSSEAPAAPPAGGGGGGRFGRGGGPPPPVARSTESERRGTDSQEYLKKEERQLLEIIRERATKREEDEAKRKKDNPRKPFTLAARQSLQSLMLSPDEKYVIATIRETVEGGKTTIVPSFVTESAYTADLSARDKVGDAQARTRVAILDVKTGESKWIEHGIKEAPAKTADGKETPPRDRPITLSRPFWSDEGSKVVLMGRASDNKDRWIFALDPATGKLRVLNTIHDDAWVDGPGSFNMGWLPDNQRIFFEWERDGYAHLYTVGFDGGEPKQLTSGKWEVRDADLTPDKSRFLLTTSEVHPGEDQAYTMSFDGGARTRLTNMPGGNRVTMSPDGTMLASIYSYTNKPPELYLLKVGESTAKPVRVTTSPAPEFNLYPWLDVPIVEVPARDGVKVAARFYKPANYRRGGPAVIFVHGAGYTQNVHREWASYSREYMFHHLLMERGYTVLDMDYRGSAGYGRDWRTAIYRHMGGKDLDDQVDGAKWLVKEHGVDPKRIGLYGGSYGGFITLMALFTQPDVFAAGAALRPVTDWAHYNHPYTSNILNLPQNDAEAYKQSSPIYFAGGLKGALLICHGMVDTNVHFQDTVRLVQRLIELHKDNWELAVFPVEDHGFVQPSSWMDEYKRILKLFETNLKPRA